MLGLKLLVLLVFAECLSIVQGLKCFECVDLPNPFQCDTVTTCPGGYKCFVDQKITSGGMILYDSGCRSPNICRTRKRDADIDDIIKRQTDIDDIIKRQTDIDYTDQEAQSDIVTCESCCDNEFCNLAGCGVPDKDRTTRGPYCFSCRIQGGKDQCRHVSQCFKGEVCSITDTSYNNVTQYKTECLISTECNQTGSSQPTRTPHGDRCSSCCDADFCNDDCLITPVNGGFTTWSSWTTCPVTCGGGHHQRSRSCTAPTPSHGGADCAGSRTNSQACGTTSCPVNGGFTTWSTWTTCPVTCGGGHHQRSRSCTAPTPSHGGADCAGSRTEGQACGTTSCPVDGGFTVWGTWTSCPVTCGGGHIHRSRTCSNPAPSHGGANCTGHYTQKQSCGTSHCPVDGGFNGWSAWTVCPVTCGGGQQQRSRLCLNPQPKYGGADCVGNDTEIQACGTAHCQVIVNGDWSTWTMWTACTRTCNGGHQGRSRTCSNPAPANGGAACTGDSTDRRGCATPHCPVNGGYTGWSAWTPCTATCGGGQTQRTRSCIKPAPAWGGTDCIGPASEYSKCSTSACPVDGGFALWGTWTSCPVTCGGGHIYRSRSCSKPAPSHGGANCTGHYTQTRSCGVGHCPVDGGFSPWGQWQPCSVSCGYGGYMWRRRLCNAPTPRHGGYDCVGNRLEHAPCHNMPYCPVDGGVSHWSPWTRCSITCGGQGQRSRSRTCTRPRPAHGGKLCTEPLHESYNCTTDLCIPPDGYGPWSDWGACSRTCGSHASQARRRTCLITHAPLSASSLTSDRTCYGNAFQTQRCGSYYCPVNGHWSTWTVWSTCSVTCGVGHGVITRNRTCSHPAPSHGGATCPGQSVDKQRCTGGQACPTPYHTIGYGHWSAWSSCSASCGPTGVQHRTLAYTNNLHHTTYRNETQKCNNWICRNDCALHDGYRYFPTSHSCLRVLSHEMTWYDARHECADGHADLAVIDSRLKDQLIYQLLQSRVTPPEHGVWIGLEGYARVWRWKHHWVILNSRYMYNNFLYRYDLLNNPKDHCGALIPRPSTSAADVALHHLPYGWASKPCDERRIAVCEKFADLH